MINIPNFAWRVQVSRQTTDVHLTSLLRYLTQTITRTSFQRWKFVGNSIIFQCYLGAFAVLYVFSFDVLFAFYTNLHSTSTAVYSKTSLEGRQRQFKVDITLILHFKYPLCELVQTPCGSSLWQC